MGLWPFNRSRRKLPFDDPAMFDADPAGLDAAGRKARPAAKADEVELTTWDHPERAQRLRAVIALWFVVAAGVTGYFLYQRALDLADPNRNLTNILGTVGGQTSAVLRDADVIKILNRKYKLQPRFSSSLSLPMVETPPSGQDFLWPSNPYGVGIYRRGAKRPMVASQVLFTSPLVVFCRPEVTQALYTRGLVGVGSGGNYRVDMRALARLVADNRPWTELGISQYRGPISLGTTLPDQTNLGMIHAGLCANILLGDRVKTAADVGRIKPRLRNVFQGANLIGENSDETVPDFMTAKHVRQPMMMGYESEALDFKLALQRSPQPNAKIGDILYPNPTVWRTHPFIAINLRGKKLMEALADPAIRDIAWERYGLRPVSGTSNAAAITVMHVPSQIDGIIALPDLSVVPALLEDL
ncbi:MAG: hypothetical protein NT029_03270 [Armatimonadetes bacterium]|nr:hypothetical protein [Armatimonadota bacterium]